MENKIPSKTELIESLKDILVVEIQAKQSYQEDIVTFKNFQILDRLRQIEKDEEKHIKMLQDLITFLGGNPEDISRH